MKLLKNGREAHLPAVSKSLTGSVEAAYGHRGLDFGNEAL